MLETGKAQLGAISPESIDDYMDEERLMDIVGRSEESSIEALSPYYPDASREDLEKNAENKRYRSQGALHQTKTE